MRSTLTFAEQYKADTPLREKALQDYYSTKIKASTIAEAKRTSKKYGNWVCMVTTPEDNIFYTRANFEQKWVRAGDIYGMWNELTLISN